LNYRAWSTYAVSRTVGDWTSKIVSVKEVNVKHGPVRVCSTNSLNIVLLGSAKHLSFTATGQGPNNQL
jgi:hypothetical protein